MSDPEPATRRFPHPVDLLALLGAALVATAAYSWFFRHAEVPRPVDPLLGTVLEVRFDADLPWKREFAPAGTALRVEGVLRATVERAGEDGPPTRRTLRVRILDRGGQDPYALTDFRWGIQRGSVVVLQDESSQVNAEVVAVEPAKKP